MPLSHEPARSKCPIATALDVVGDKWSLVILRDMLGGKSRFSDFLDSPEGIRKNILTERLKRMTALGLVCRRKYQERPDRYEYVLTQAGADTLPVLQELAKWSSKHFCDLWTPSEAFLKRRIPKIDR